MKQVFGNDLIKNILSQNKVIIRNPKLKVIYQDTDSNYCEMQTLYKGEVKEQYQDMKRYVQTTASGLYNNFFCEVILKVMGKYPLKFNFEGAFYMAYYITKKNYLGQKIGAITCKIENGKVIPLNEKGKQEDCIKTRIQLDDYEHGDIGQYLDSKHIKVTGLKLIKRNTILLAKKMYLRMIEMVLNERNNQQRQNVLYMIQYISQSFNQIDLDALTERKKVTSSWIKSNQYLVQKHQIGLGDIIQLYYSKPSFLNENRMPTSNYKKSNYIVVHKINGVIVDKQVPHKAQYILNILSNLLSFLDNDINDKQIRQFAEDNQLILFGWPKLKLKNIQFSQTEQLFKHMLQFNNMDYVMDYEGFRVSFSDVFQFIYEVSQKDGENKMKAIQLLLSYTDK